MRTENQENYGQDDRDFHLYQAVTDPSADENSSYVDEYESNKTDTDYDPNEEIVNEDDAITNDQENLDEQFLDALQDDEDEETYDDQNNLDRNSFVSDYDDNVNEDDEDLYEEDEDEHDLDDNNLNDLEGDHLNNPDLNREEQKIRNKDSFKVD